MIKRVTKFPNRLEVLLESGEVLGLSSFSGELLGWDRWTYAVTFGQMAQVYDGYGKPVFSMVIPSGWSDLRWDGQYFTYLVDNTFQYVCEPSGRPVSGPINIR